MKTKTQKQKVNLVTMGCSKNLVDSEQILTQLKANKIEASHNASNDDANIVIINTCGFIDEAKQESIDMILQFAEAKKEGSLQKLYVSGCLSQRYRDELKQEIPAVDDWFGTREMSLLLKRLNANFKKELVGERVLTSQKHYAYLKISEGCDRPCSFCAIPLMRGKHISKPIEAVIAEATYLAQQGVKEIMLIAQDSTYYGLDLYGKRNLAELLLKLSEIESLEWIRLHYAFPTGFPEDILEVIQSKKNICNYLDIPLQHASTKILKLMRRGTTAEKMSALIHQIRDKVPNIALRTTMLVGHPQETEKDFEMLLQFIKEHRFERLGAFTYSHEEQTHSFSFDDNVPTSVKEERVAILMEEQEKISYQLNQPKVGQELKVLIDRKESDIYIGRTEHDSPEVDNEVIIPQNEINVKVGDFVQVKITSAGAFDLEGTILPNNENK